MAEQGITLMAWLRRLLTADPGYQPAMISMGGLCLAALVTALFVTDGRSTGSRAGGRIARLAPESQCAINYPEPAAATAVPPVPVTGGLS
jgi:hypothetical protein